MADDKPYDEFAREILGATGDEVTNPPTVWYKELQEPQQFVDDTAQVFLGLRLACAQCHHHPYEKWSQDDYWGIAAYFGRVGRQEHPDARRIHAAASRSRDWRSSAAPPATSSTRSTRPAGDHEAAGRQAGEVGPDDDPRQKLVDWMVDRDKSVLRPRRGQPLLGALLRPRHRRSVGRHARDQPAVATPNCWTRWPKTWSTTTTVLKSPRQDDRQEPDVSAQLDAERVQPARQAELRSLLSCAA